jgi:alkanesulfonate monooxygenase SsuD/methylene tetrahydromethanopterin reductase-like flavin-dependent oxidoreductase (luciferase family)
LQVRLPIWVGGGGEKVTLRIAAQYADGWNVPFIAPDAWAHKAHVLDMHCEKLDRDPQHHCRGRRSCTRAWLWERSAPHRLCA